MFVCVWVSERLGVCWCGWSAVSILVNHLGLVVPAWVLEFIWRHFNVLRDVKTFLQLSYSGPVDIFGLNHLPLLQHVLQDL